MSIIPSPQSPIFGTGGIFSSLQQGVFSGTTPVISPVTNMQPQQHQPASLFGTNPFNGLGTGTPVVPNTATPSLNTTSNLQAPNTGFNFSQPIPQTGANNLSHWNVGGGTQQAANNMQLSNTIEQQTAAIKFLLDAVHHQHQQLNYLGLTFSNQLQGSTLTGHPLNQCTGSHNNNPYFSSPSGHSSSLAIQYLQMAITDHQERLKREGNKSGMWRNPLDNYPRSIMSSESLIRIPTRKEASTCLSDLWEKPGHQHRKSLYFKQGNGNVRINDTVYTGCHWNRDRIPRTTSRLHFSSIGNDRKAYGHGNNVSSCLYENFNTDLISERDAKWKVLSEKVVKKVHDNHYASTKFHQANTDISGVLRSPTPDHHKNSCHNRHSDFRNREPHQMWNFKVPSWGPPTQSHLDDECPDLYHNLKKSYVPKRSSHTKKMYLPGRFRFESVKNITKPRKLSSTNATALKDDVRFLFRRWSSGDSKHSLHLEEKSSPVLFSTGWKPTAYKDNETKFSSMSTARRNQKSDRYTVRNVQLRELNPAVEKQFKQVDNTVRNVYSQLKTLPVKVPKVAMELEMSDESATPTEESIKSANKKVILTKPEYYCFPDVKMLDSLTCQNSGKCLVKNFEVGHVEHGKVMFGGYTDVAGLDLDKIVHFTFGGLTLYPDSIDKPAFGEGLNRPCTVTLKNIWPPENSVDGNGDVPGLLMESDDTEIRFENQLKKQCSTWGGEFIRYCPDSGEWSFMGHLR